MQLKRERELSYYVKVATRSSGATSKGTAAQAMDYLTDGHDEGLEASMSQEEVDYIARSNPGQKTDMEGGAVPLYGHGKFAGQQDSPELRAAFAKACLPVDSRGTTGYKSITLTLPKEVSLFLEAHKEQGKEAMQRALGQAIEKMYPNVNLSAVGAIHTRNSNGEVHFHAHALVSKFAERKSDGRILSLNGKAVQGELAPVFALKQAWKEAVNAELKKEFGITIEQSKPNGAAKIRTAEGITLEPLNRETRRQLEKALEPTINVTDENGNVRTSKLKLNEMHSRIYTVAMRDKGRGGWSAEAFKEMYPELAGKAVTYDKMAARLKQFGYLTEEGRATRDFKNHATAKWGNQLTPELFKLRVELAQAAQARAKKEGKPVQVPTLSQVANRETSSLWDRVERVEQIRKRIEKLGYTPAEVQRIEDRARKAAPQKWEKDIARDDARSKFLFEHKGEALQKVKSGEHFKGSIFSAFVDLQKAKIQRTYLELAGTVRGDFTARKLEADKNVKAHEKELGARKAALLARTETLSKAAIFTREVFRAGNLRRPVSFVLARASQKATSRLENAKTTVARIASWQEKKEADRAGLLGERRLVGDWKKEYLEKPLDELRERSKRFEAPGQSQQLERLEKVREAFQKLGNPEPTEREIKALSMGREAMEKAGMPAAQKLMGFAGSEADLSKAVYVTSMQRDLEPGNPALLEKETYEAARQAYAIGDRLTKEQDAAEKAKAAIPSNHAGMAKDIETINKRMEAFGLKPPFTVERLRELAPGDTAKEIQKAKDAGFLSEGPEWATKRPGEVRQMAGEMEKSINKNTEQARGIEDQLINRRFQA